MFSRYHGLIIVRRLVARLFIVIALVSSGAVTAMAHAFLARASPAVGSTIRAAPAEITLRFTEPIEPSFSSIEVTGPGGDRVDGGDLRGDGNDRSVLHTSLKPLAAGSYKVVWRVVSIDTHITNGDFRFTVAP
jgi:methionine-rich copper-binding protein CopC